NIINSPSWNLHPFYSDDLDFIDLTLRSIPTSPNTDGFDPESCRNVRLLGTRIYVGDDCVAIKSGKKIMADEYYRPCEDLLIRNCYMGEGHGGVVFGSESSCGIRNVDVSKCIFKNTDRGLRIKTKRGRGYKAVVENVSFDNILMDGVESCFVVNMYYYLSRYGYDDYADSKEYSEVSEQTPHVGEFHFKNIECLNTKVCAGYFYGLPESRIDLISLENVKVTYDQDYSEYKTPAMIYECEKVNKGPFYFYNVEKVELSEVYLEGQKLEEVTIHNS
ncbi:MAG: glycoside hydrolase family 28 protein, partial [Erysipelotrichaceae bacterium]|nr:glycoside hydrolase family 28 protein [Erysipelotrichaceae bacterium]